MVWIWVCFSQKKGLLSFGKELIVDCLGVVVWIDWLRNKDEEDREKERSEEVEEEEEEEEETMDPATYDTYKEGIDLFWNFRLKDADQCLQKYSKTDLACSWALAEVFCCFALSSFCFSIEARPDM